ncbi:MAG: hypothetical protein RL329_758 [Bacteroidota bacterium]
MNESTKQMTNREKFLALVSAVDTQTEIENDWEIANRLWLRASQKIALDILKQLTRLGWTQKELADKWVSVRNIFIKSSSSW